MTDLADWLLAQIADDETAAQHARWAMQDQWFVEADDKVDEFVLRMSPARVLADCAAKRAIVEEHAPRVVRGDVIDIYEDECQTCHGSEPGMYPCMTLRLLAQPYADRPGFDPAWKVEEQSG